MSGGSYNYLCYANSESIFGHIDDLNRMRDKLIELGHLDAAKETESIILIINSFILRVDSRIERLSGVWKAVEWYDCGDYEIDGIKNAIEKYQNL